MNDYAHFGLGLCLLRQGDRLGARRHLKLAVAMRPEQPDYRDALAKVVDDPDTAMPRRTTAGSDGADGDRGGWPGVAVTDPAGAMPNGASEASGDAPVVCCDLDGVIWRGDEPIAPAAAGIAALRAAGLRVGFVSNNSSQPVAEVAAKLERCGVPAEPDDVLTSALAAAACSPRPARRARACSCARAPASSRRWRGVGFTPGARPAGRRRSSSASTATSTSTGSTARPARCATAPGSSPPTSMRPTRCRAGVLPGAGSIVAAVADRVGLPARGGGQARSARRSALVRAPLRRPRRRGRRPAVDRRRARRRAGVAVRARAVGRHRRGRAAGRRGDPDPPPPFVAADLGALAPAARRGPQR